METTGRRNLTYSSWHRQLGYNCPAQDLDWIEYDRGIPVAVIEVTTGQLSDLQKKVIKNLIQPEIPAYEVSHNEKLTGFHVKQFLGGDFDDMMGWKGYTEFLYQLRGRIPPRFVKPKIKTALDHIYPWISELTQQEKDELIEELQGDF